MYNGGGISATIYDFGGSAGPCAWRIGDSGEGGVILCPFIYIFLL